MRALALLLTMLIVATAVRAAPQTPEDAVHGFYTWVLAHPAHGLPSADERDELAKVLSPTIIRLLATASETEASCIKVTPAGDKPSVIEGDVFVGVYEGATEVAYSDLRPSGDAMVVESHLIYVDTSVPKAHKHRALVWKNQLSLMLAADRWYIENVQFDAQRSLVASLEAYIQEGAQTCIKP
jgi:hypothetical protein